MDIVPYKMHIRGLIVAFACLCVLNACATAPPIQQVEINTPLTISPSTHAKPLMFKKIVVRLQHGSKIGMVELGLLCVPRSPLTWEGGSVTLTGDDLTDVFRSELTKSNYPLVGNPDALFEDPSDWKAQLLIAGLVKDLHANVCYPDAGFGNYSTVKGAAHIAVDWQIYSRLDRKVVYETTTEGSSNETTSSGPQDIFLAAFAAATDNLLANKGFHDLVAESNSATYETKRESLLDVIGPSQYKNNIEKHINDVRSAVVTVFAGDGFGSGFFISSSGLLLTDEHVVGDARFVKVKLTTGREMLGEVMRKNARRDVALVKVEETDMVPVPMRLTELNIGEPVYAIGTPLSEDLNTTMSKGIVSAYRDIDGQKYIQSDVNVLPGNSGGPVVDDLGNVVGLTDMAITTDGVPAGVNLFIPIHEAISTLDINIHYKANKNINR